MAAMDEASLRTLRWRVEGLPVRLGQILLIGGIFWLYVRGSLPIWWSAAAIATALIDADLSRRHLAQLDNWRFAVLTTLSRTASAGAFAAVCFVLLTDRSGVGLAAAMLVGCAMNLNNAVMTRGSRRFFLSTVAPTSVCLVAVPFVAWRIGQSLSLAGAGILTVGAVAYAVFIALLARALFNESQALRSALEAAEAASRSKSTFLAVTSHEIRTPLNGVLGMAQAMENDTLSRVQRGRVGVIRQSGEALLEILNDILDLAKIEAGKLDLETAPFDVEAVTLSAVRAFSATALAKGLTYGVDFDPAASGSYDGDSARLRQVLCNLISNAVKFTETGEVAVSVTAHAAGVRLSVRDTGPGVPDGLADRLFEKFTQADSSTTRRFGGTGLGLAICRELCEAMGGTIAVSSGPQGGSIFTVDLPLARSVAEATAEPAATAAAPQALGSCDRPLRVLAAEDNAVNQLVLRTLLEQIGVEATIVDDGAEAIRAWEDADFDLILMDVQMPRMDGPTAARAIRAREVVSGRARSPIIALTANVMSHQLAAYTAAGMDAFVAKPISIVDLYAAIARCTAEAVEAPPARPYTASR
jgi:signal transduction histidine kinase